MSDRKYEGYGARCYRDGKSIEDNPYHPAKALWEYEAWKKGYEVERLYWENHEDAKVQEKD